MMERLTITVGECTHAVPAKLGSARLITMPFGMRVSAGTMFGLHGELFDAIEVLCAEHVLAKPVNRAEVDGILDEAIELAEQARRR